jgi:two-component system phosphate regulon sensor histidine kinase PhoR
VTVFYDISEIRRLERVRKDFVANVSHELRTPLTTIRGCAATLVDGALEEPDAAKRFVASINRHAERLQFLLDDLLDLSRLESGTLEIEPVPFNLAEVVDTAIETVRNASVERHIDVISVVAPSLVLTGDPGLIQQALVNLLDNAIKYTNAGGRVVVTAGSMDSRALPDPNVPVASPDLPPNVRPVLGGGPRSFVEISDNGPGIPIDDLSRIFERFYRVEKARSRAMGGTGLGLSIVRHILEAHGERVYVRSELGRGSVFGFSLPTLERSLES